VRHYQGFARGRMHRLAEPDPTVKHLLYAYRVLLTGIHLMTHGEVEANINTLNKRAGLAAVDELVARKREGAEKMPLSAGELEAQVALLNKLLSQLDAAHEASALPEEPTTKAALDSWVVHLRLANGAS
jgi:hypothetical protein